MFYRSKPRRRVCASPPRSAGSKGFRPRIEFLEQRLTPANVDVLTWHNDNLLSGSNNQEENLTPANVSSVVPPAKLFTLNTAAPVSVTAPKLNPAVPLAGYTVAPEACFFLAVAHCPRYRP